MKKDRIIERMVATGVWTSETALHTGGEETLENHVDMALLRTGGGAFFIPGSSIAGAARSHLSRMSAASDKDYRSGGQSRAMHALFGDDDHADSSRREAARYGSLLIVSDSLAITEASALVRENVRLDSKSGIADDRAKFNLEVLPAGVQFAFRVQLLVYEELPGKIEVAELKAYFQALLSAYATGQIGLGARTRKGLGRGRVAAWDVRRFDMTHRPHVGAWLRRDWPGGEAVPLGKIAATSMQSKSAWLEIEADCRLKTSLLIRAGNEDPTLPDMTHLSENQKPLLSGTSLAGALRHRVERIANTLWGRDAGGRAAVDLFGPLHKGKKGEGLFAGRVWVSEQEVENCELAVQSRVALDRFTGGALETALFDEAACWPIAGDERNVRLQVRLELRGDEREDQRFSALLLQGFKDLWLGDLTVGGETGVGRGVLEGLSAKLQRTGWASVEMKRTGRDTAEVSGWDERWARMSEIQEAGR